MRKLKLKGFSAVVPTFAVTFAIMILVRPQSALEGVRSGLNMSAGVIVPSMFPFLVVSSFVSGASVFKGFNKVLQPVMKWLFRLPAEAFSAILFGLTGGFPVGCSVTARLLEQGKIDREQAQRLTLFCINAGPAFAVTAVGTVMLGSTRAGVILYLSVCISSLITGFALGLVAPFPTQSSAQIKADLPALHLLVDATERSAMAIIRVCAWVTLFSCGFSLLDSFGLNEKFLVGLRCITEVTGGCRAAADSGNIFVVAATLGWSGLCVICQVFGDVRKAGTPVFVLLAFKAFHAGLSAVVCCCLVKLFPVEASVFSSFTGKMGGELFSASAPATVALLCLCVVFVIDLARNKKLC